jgi:hypothetical protein
VASFTDPSRGHDEIRTGKRPPARANTSPLRRQTRRWSPPEGATIVFDPLLQTLRYFNVPSVTSISMTWPSRLTSTSTVSPGL